MVPALPEVRNDRTHADGDRSKVDLGERCFQCHRVAYMCEREGEDTLSGWICRWCIGLMDGAYRTK